MIGLLQSCPIEICEYPLEKIDVENYYIPRKPFELINFGNELSPPHIDLNQLLIWRRQHPIVQWTIVPAVCNYFLFGTENMFLFLYIDTMGN